MQNLSNRAAFEFQALQELRLQRAAVHVHDLGARPVYELLRDLAAMHGDIEPVLRIAQGYQRLTVEMVQTAGGDRFAPRIRVVK